MPPLKRKKIKAGPGGRSGTRRPRGPRRPAPDFKKPARKLGSVDYKNVELLRKFISENGKILPRRLTRLSAADQRKLARAIKRARTLALLPFKST